jgi:hypothetical protein
VLACLLVGIMFLLCCAMPCCDVLCMLSALFWGR